MDEAIVDAFHTTARLTRSDVFSGQALTPIVALEDANTPAPGWVGDHWRQGTVLIRINPGGGGDAYRRNPTDDQLYAHCASFATRIRPTTRSRSRTCRTLGDRSKRRTVFGGSLVPSLKQSARASEKLAL